MRYSIFIFLLMIAFGCNPKSEGLELSGNIKGLKKGTLYLQKLQDTTLLDLDSLIMDGKSDFRFNVPLKEPEILYLHLHLKDGSLADDRISFFAEKGKIDIQTTLKRFGSDARISGSENDSIWRAYNKIRQRFIDQNLELVEKRLKLKPGKDDSLIQSIDARQQKLISNKYFTTINFAINHKEHEIAPYLILSEAYNVNIKYLDTVYNALDSKIKNSKYGLHLESFIKERKQSEDL